MGAMSMLGGAGGIGGSSPQGGAATSKAGDVRSDVSGGTIAGSTGEGNRGIVLEWPGASLTSNPRVNSPLLGLGSTAGLGLAVAGIVGGVLLLTIFLRRR